MSRYRREGARLELYDRTLDHLRALCLGWPFTSEASSWGNPTFMFNGKAIAVLDQYKGADCVWLRCERPLRTELLARNGYFTTPYDKNEVGICCRLDDVPWEEIAGLVRKSYEGLMV